MKDIIIHIWSSANEDGSGEVKWRCVFLEGLHQGSMYGNHCPTRDLKADENEIITLFTKQISDVVEQLLNEEVDE